MRSHIPSPPEPRAWTGPPPPAPCVHDWAHAGVRWWIDASDPPISWVRYVDQFHCRRCLEVTSRPIDYRQRFGDMAPKEGTFAIDSAMGARLRDAALACLTPTSAVPAPDADAAPAARAD